jgi:hypothetical protein
LATVSSNHGGGGGDDSDAPEDDDQTQQTNATQTAGTAPAQHAAPASNDNSDTPDAPTTDIRLSLPPALPPVAAPTETTTLAGAGIHVLTLPQPEAGSLLAAQADAAAPVVLALERQAADGWTTVAIDTGLGRWHRHRVAG